MAEDGILLGNNHCFVVATKYKIYALVNVCSPCNVERVKMKFYWPPTTKKPTGNPSCPPNLRCAKEVGRKRIFLVNTGNVESFNEDENEAGPDNEQVVSGTDSETMKASGSSGTDTPSVVRNKGVLHNAVGTRAKRRKSVMCLSLLLGSFAQ